MRHKLFLRSSLFVLSAILLLAFIGLKKWESKFIKINKDGTLSYIPDEKGNIIPDFSRVGRTPKIFGPFIFGEGPSFGVRIYLDKVS